MSNRILVTGAAGLIGRSLRTALQTRGMIVEGLDVRSKGAECIDVRDLAAVRQAIDGCVGVVHLAAVSRVVWGEQYPDLCRATNIGGLMNILDSAMKATESPWVIFASSREVYGQADHLPADEDTPLCPLNIYARSKVEGENLVNAARSEGLRASIIRLSNVYGCTRDHVDRVVPAFARAAAIGHPLRVEGADRSFDFTHVTDVTRGIVALIEILQRGQEAPQPIHFVTGHPTTLGQLAHMAIDIARSNSPIHHAPARNYDVAEFHGCSARARALLDWSPRISIREGLAELIQAFRTEHAA